MHGVTWSVRGRRRWRPLVDTLAVVACCAGAVALALSPALRGSGSVLGPTFTLLTLATAAATTGSAILAETAARVRDERRWSWMAACFALYGVLVLPVRVLAPVDSPRLLLMRITAYVTALALLVVSLRPPRSAGPRLPWGLAAAGAALATAALAVPDALVPTGALQALLAAVVLPGWAAVAVVFVVEGHRRRSRPRLRLGLGMASVAAAQVVRAVAGVSTAYPPFVALRLVGAVVVLVALAQIVARSLTEVHDRQCAQQEELAEEVLHLRRAGELVAERDHELRNGLAGLAGITHLLHRDTAGAEQRELEHAVVSELGRLHDLLGHGAGDGGDTFGADGSGGGREAERAAGYLVEPVLAGLVTLRRSAGAAAAVVAEPGLRACGEPAVLAQVLVNLFANCDRHAPGAPVTVRSYRCGDQAVVEVRDEGPGLRGTPGRDLLRRGVHDPDAGGSGLGLHISARLVHGEGGELDLRSVTDPPGCLATVRLPAAGPVDRVEAGRPDAAAAL
jgi:two-component system OmpR family sensor kinase